MASMGFMTFPKQCLQWVSRHSRNRPATKLIVFVLSPLLSQLIESAINAGLSGSTTTLYNRRFTSRREGPLSAELRSAYRRSCGSPVRIRITSSRSFISGIDCIALLEAWIDHPSTTLKSTVDSFWMLYSDRVRPSSSCFVAKIKRC